MIRTLNFTGRQRILREEARITLQTEVGGAVAFDAELDLGRLDLPADARIYLEAAFKTTFMRFDWGTVAQPASPENRRLMRLEQPGLAHFRVKVVQSAANGLGRLLAVADRIAPEGVREGEKRRASLFRVSYTSAFSDKIWRLVFDDGGPILELQRMTGIKEIVRQEAFMALVFPEVIRQVLRRIFADGNDDFRADPPWQARWLRFGAQHAGKLPPQLLNDGPDPEHEEWIDDAIEDFSSQLKLVKKFKKRFAGAEAESP